ncbi:unnamed protein product [Blumeria hordei]|uniref:Uncharacterized protein n=1 Tax=Blumeria hordei TaxID=2867405 RepID=A0A383UNM8_BLUHO|nr:unnamed protein product [Blumeria hordei]
MTCTRLALIDYDIEKASFNKVKLEAI